MDKNFFSNSPEYDDSEDAQRAFEESNEMSNDTPKMFEKGFLVIRGPNGPIKVEMSSSELEKFKKNPDEYARKLRNTILVKKSEFWRKMMEYRRFPIFGGEYILFMIDMFENDTDATVFMEIHPNPEANHPHSLVDIMAYPAIQQYIAFCVSWEYGLRITDYHDISMKMMVEDLPNKKSAKISIIAHCDRRTLNFIQDTAPIDWISDTSENICMDSEFLGRKYHSQIMTVKHIYEPVFGVEGIYTFGGLEEIDFLDERINTEQVFVELCRPLLLKLVHTIYPIQCMSSILAHTDMKYVHFMMDIERSHKMLKITVYAIPGYITADDRSCKPISYFGNRELIMNTSNIEILNPEYGERPFNQTTHWMGFCSSQYSQVFTLVALQDGCAIINGDAVIPLHFYEILFLFGIKASETAITLWRNCAFTDNNDEITYPAVVSCDTVAGNHPIVKMIHLPEEPAYLSENPVDPENHRYVQVMGFVDCKISIVESSDENPRTVLEPFIAKYMGVPLGIDPKTWSVKNAYIVHCYDNADMIRFAIIAQITDPSAEVSPKELDNKKK